MAQTTPQPIPQQTARQTTPRDPVNSANTANIAAPASPVNAAPRNASAPCAWAARAADAALIAALTAGASVAGTLLGGRPVFKLFGALIIALVIGFALQIPLGAWYGHGGAAHRTAVRTSAGFISNKFLRLGIILLGFKLNLQQLFAAGVKTIALAACIVAVTITITYRVARRLGVEPHLAILTAGGTGICGAAAVMGISGSMPLDEGAASPEDAEKWHEDEAMAVAIVAIMGTLFALGELALRPVLGLTDVQFGTMGGASLHEIAHAVAVGGAAGDAGMNAAIIMKLSRVLMLAPAAIIIGAWWARSPHGAATGGSKHVPIPWFMLGFVLASIAGTYIPAVQAATAMLVTIAYLVLGMAMAALGTNVDFKAIARRGRTAFLASLLVSVLLACLAFAAAKLLF
ncbi:MAG: putative sulfate exporter family transporter [Bifidobacteriaceae bacterium]|nr:putative sulfate exporter family transporter [Bifidobacteriaceae bacterium]